MHADVLLLLEGDGHDVIHVDVLLLNDVHLELEDDDHDVIHHSCPVSSMMFISSFKMMTGMSLIMLFVPVSSFKVGMLLLKMFRLKT